MEGKTTPLQGQVESYLQSAGFSLLNTKEGFVIADKGALGGERESLLIWIPIDRSRKRRLSQTEAALLDEIEAEIPNYGGARCFVLVPNLEGLSRDFRTEARRLGVKIRAPVQFFDAPFRFEDAPETASAIQTLRYECQPSRRVPQPYSILEDQEPQVTGDDLLVTLRDELIRASGPRLRIVVGTAGAGKSILFQNLFSLIYDHFLERKKSINLFPRPVPFIPDYLRDVYSLRTSDLINAFLRSDVAAPVTPETFEWMVVHGYSSWFFDGLDELYAGDVEFFDNLLDLLTRPGSKAQILIFCRDSLLTTNDGFSRFLEDFPPGIDTTVKMYRLENWERRSKRSMAWLHFEGRAHKKKEKDTERVSQFLTQISTSPTLTQITGVPYYCCLLLDSFENGNIKDFKDDFSVVKHAVDSIVDREMKKGLLSLDYFEKEGLNLWLESTALDAWQSNFSGFSSQDVEDYAELVLRLELSPEERSNAVMSLTQFPLFAPGLRPGTVNFKHELVAEYLVGRHLARLIVGQPKKAAQSLRGRTDFSDSLTCRYLSNHIKGNKSAISQIFAALRTESFIDTEFALLLQIILSAEPEKSLLKDNKTLLEQRNLCGLHFFNLDLARVSFRNSDLSNTRIHNCNLEGAMFEGTRLSETRFENMADNAFRETKFGNLEKFGSIFVNGQRIDDRKRMKRWVSKVTGEPEEIEDPCPAALQLSTLFLKFVRPDGSGRRDELQEDALRRGKLFQGAPRPDECIKECLRMGYLQGPDFRRRVRRVPGEGYDEIVCYVRDWTLSSNLRKLLDTICPIRNCRHVPLGFGL